jgi:hypothetical protein
LEDGVSGPAAPVEGVEYRDAVGAAYRRLAVQGERLGAQHGLAVAADDQP